MATTFEVKVVLRARKDQTTDENTRELCRQFERFVDAIRLLGTIQQHDIIKTENGTTTTIY